MNNPQSGKLSLTLTPDLAGFVRGQTKSGKYASANEVVQEALRLLEAAEQLRSQSLDDVKTKIAAGLGSLKRGEDFDGEAVFQELEQSLSSPRRKTSRR